MSWRMARSLEVALAEINAAAPRRSKISDGGIGDAKHATRTSDHNPWVKDRNGTGVVRARDYTDDPKGGFSAAAYANHVASMLGKHPALGAGAYVIYNRRIISTNRLDESWRYYSGINAHKQHVHVSVGTSGYDSTAPWGWPPKPEQKDWFTMATKKELREVIRAELDDLPRDVWKYPIPATDGAPAQKVLRQAGRSLHVTQKVRDIVRRRFNATDDQLDALMDELAELADQEDPDAA